MRSEGEEGRFMVTGDVWHLACEANATEDVLEQFCDLSSSGSVDLTYSEALYKDLSKGLEGLLLNSYLHLVYLVTPYDMISQCKPDWMIYFRQVLSCYWTWYSHYFTHLCEPVTLIGLFQFTLLSAAEQKMSAAVGVPESFVARKAAGQTVKKVKKKTWSQLYKIINSCCDTLVQTNQTFLSVKC